MKFLSRVGLCVLSVLAASPIAKATSIYHPVSQVTASDLIQIKALYQEKLHQEWDSNAFCEAEGIEVALRLELVEQTSELEVFSTSTVSCKNQKIRIQWDSCLVRFTQNGPELYYCDNGLAD